MKLLDVAVQLDAITMHGWYLLQNCLTARREWLEEREPESSGITHDNWDEKYEDWNDLCDLCEEIILLKNSDQDATEEMEDLCDNIWAFHYSYGGISRLKV